MGAPKIKSDAIKRAKNFKRLVREGPAVVTVLMRGNKIEGVFSTTSKAVKYSEQYPANDYEFHERVVSV